MKNKINTQLIRMRCIAEKVMDNRGSDYVETLIKILIAVVVGALLLGGLTMLFNTLWPQVTQQIIDMFTGGTTSTPSGGSSTI